MADKTNSPAPIATKALVGPKLMNQLLSQFGEANPNPVCRIFGFRVICKEHIPGNTVVFCSGDEIVGIIQDAGHAGDDT